MSKVIVYTSVDNGMTGEDADSICYASLDEDKLKSLINRDKSKAWRTQKDMIVDMELAKRQALAKLDGLDRLALGLPMDERYFKK